MATGRELNAIVASAPSEITDRPGPLKGWSIPVKDLIAVRGLPQGGGLDPPIVPVSGRDAPCVRALKRAGAHIPFTTALYALGYGDHGIVCPDVVNPVRPECYVGGSSGGSAAVVAAGLARVALGTDAGGSVRIPAACTGVVGFKPTTGSISNADVLTLTETLDTVGLLGSKPLDLEAVLPHMGLEPWANLGDGPWFRRLVVPRGYLEDPKEGRVPEQFDRAISLLRESSLQVDVVEVEGLLDAHAAARCALAFQASRRHRRLLEERYHDIPEDVRARLEGGMEISPASYEAAVSEGRRLASIVHGLLDQDDLLMTPTLPCEPPKRGTREVEMGGHMVPLTQALNRYTNVWNLLGNPAGAVPVRQPPGWPLFSLQVVARTNEDRRLIRSMCQLFGLLGKQ